MVVVAAAALNCERKGDSILTQQKVVLEIEAYCVFVEGGVISEVQMF